MQEVVVYSSEEEYVPVQEPKKAGWFTRAANSISSGASSAWNWLKPKAKALVQAAKNPVTFFYLAIAGSSMWYAGGMALIRNHALLESVPGLALLAFTISGFGLTYVVSFRPRSEKGIKNFRISHYTFNAVSQILNSTGLFYVVFDGIAHYVGGPELGSFAKIAVPIAAVASSLTVVGSVILAKKMQPKCMDSPAFKLIKKGFIGALEYGSAPGGALYILRDARNSANEPVFGGSTIMIIAGAYAAFGLVNETIINCCSENIAFKLRMVVKDVTQGLSATAFTVDQAWELEAVAYIHNPDGIPPTLFHATWSVGAAVTLVPNVMITVYNDKVNHESRLQNDPEHQRLLAEQEPEEKLFTWTAPECCHRRRLNQHNSGNIQAVRQLGIFGEGNHDLMEEEKAPKETTLVVSEEIVNPKRRDTV